jgi:uncharacterized protein YdcH (DUF465 family)
MAGELRDELIASHEGFRRLAEKHSEYSSRIDLICSKPYPSEDDKLEEIKLKKLKLKVKDEMEVIARSHGTRNHVA